MASITLSLLFIYLLKRVWKNRRVKRNIYRKHFLNLECGKDNCRKSHFARPNSKLYCFKFCATFQQLRLLNFKDRPRNFATSKIRFLRQERTFFSFLFTTITKKYFFNVAGSLDPSLDCDNFVF